MHNFNASHSSARSHRDPEEATLEEHFDDLGQFENDLEDDSATVDLGNGEGGEDVAQTRKNSKAAAGDVVGLYFADIRGIALLTWEEECDLAQRLENQRDAIEELKRPGLSDIRRGELEFIVRDGGEARDQLFKSNVRLAISIARRYINRGVALADLIQEANLGLLKAIEKFDRHRGFRFSTYATWWIRQSVARAVADQGRTIRIPVHTNDQLRRIMQIQQLWLQECGQLPSESELIEETGFAPDRVHYLLTLVDQAPDSLDRPVSDVDPDSYLGDFIEDPNEPVQEAVATKLLNEKLMAILNRMSDQRQAMIIKMRYGLLDGKEYSSAEIGCALGLEVGDVRRTEARALYYLRGPSARSQLRDYTPA